MEYELYLMELVKIRYLLIALVVILLIIMVIIAADLCIRAKAEIRYQILEETEMFSHISGGKNGSEKE